MIHDIVRKAVFSGVGGTVAVKGGVVASNASAFDNTVVRGVSADTASFSASLSSSANSTFATMLGTTLPAGALGAFLIIPAGSSVYVSADGANTTTSDLPLKSGLWFFGALAANGVMEHVTSYELSTLEDTVEALRPDVVGATILTADGSAFDYPVRVHAIHVFNGSSLIITGVRDGGSGGTIRFGPTTAITGQALFDLKGMRFETDCYVDFGTGTGSVLVIGEAI